MISNTLKHFWNFNDFMSLKFLLFYLKSAYVKAFPMKSSVSILKSKLMI